MRHLQRGTHFAPLALLLGLTLALGACDEPSSTELGGDGNGLARISILLTDAPGEVAEAWVIFDAIYLQGGDAGRVFLLETPTDWINLKELTGGEVEQLVSGVTVPDGFYGQLRFVITKAVLATGDGMTIDNAYATPDVDADDLAALNAMRDPALAPLDPMDELKCPSCGRSGLKLNFRDGGLEVTGETLVLADFDVSQSFGHQAGMSGRWIMHPVINAMVMGGGAGAIAGIVSLGQGVSLPASCGGQTITLADFVPTAESGMMTWSGTVATDGSYEIASLPPSNDYVLGFIDEIEYTNGDELNFTADILDASDTPITGPVEVVDGMTFIANYVITNAECM